MNYSHNHMKTNSNPIKERHIKCVVCSKTLSGRQAKYCSRKCHNKHGNIKHQNYASQQKRGLKRKINLVERKGGKCELCGYQYNYSALSFHHSNPATKNFGLDLRACSNHKWETLLEESNKCQLLCLNCHANLHHPLLRRSFS